MEGGSRCAGAPAVAKKQIYRGNPMNKEHSFTTTQVLGLLGDVLYPNPDGDDPRTVVWWHGRPYPWPGPVAFGNFKADPAHLGTVEKAASIALLAALLQRAAGGERGEIESPALARLGGALFDDYCGTVPISELLKRLLHRPPPPPPPGWREYEKAILLAQVAGRLQSGAARAEVERDIEQSMQ